MKSVDLKDIPGLPGQKLETKDEFHFKCHKGLTCFNLCCRNLNLFLYPYDVIRLKNNLNISSGEFIDRYTDIVLRPGNHFPDVLLKMADNDAKTCPYLSDTGCLVYPDRPDACRTFPVEQGVMFRDGAQPEPVFFFRPPDFCLGQHETQVFTIDTWADDQDAATYNAMTVLWAGLIGLFQADPWGGEGPGGNRGKMAFMALYNVDAFREFVFGSSFLKRYKVKEDIRKKIKRNDVEMMKFGFDFVKVSFFQMSSKRLRLK
ncbi:MAG: YkgJ family cysteine cluster protein [Proteobacteria bacterium]|nr:YkgJ family cysteine cluster protein [Pseudomonadota bacterium]